MLNFILSIVVLCKSIVRKSYSLIPAAILIALYELVCMFEVQLMDYAGLLERILATLLLAAVLFGCLKEQLHICGVLFAVPVALLRWSWVRVFDWFRMVMQDPGSNAAALLRQAAMVRDVFQVLIFALILALQILMLWELRKKRMDERGIPYGSEVGIRK